MAGGCRRRTLSRQRTVGGLVNDTKRALEDVHDILHVEPDTYTRVSDIGDRVGNPTAIVVLGRNNECQVRMIHCLLGSKLLPEKLPENRRWVRIKFGSTNQVHLSLGNSEFELVEELHCLNNSWDLIPEQDLIRQESTDFATILEIELNNQFLKEGLQILLPPDLEISQSDQNLPLLELKEKYQELYTKRESILKNFNAVYMFALDCIGEECFKQNMYFGKSSFLREDFWSCYSLYYLSSIESEMQREGEIEEKVEERNVDNCVLNSKNCLDLYQMKSMCRASQVQFVLLGGGSRVGGVATDVTESAEHWQDELPEEDRLQQSGNQDESQLRRRVRVEKRRLFEEQCAFMGELLEQWEHMSKFDRMLPEFTSIPPKYSAKSQYIILDEESIMSTADQGGARSCSTGVEVKQQGTLSRGCADKTVTSRTGLINKISKFVVDTVNTYLLEYSTILSEIHVKMLQQFILASFDLARELQVIPKKIQYVATQEQRLYEVITEKFTRGEKKQELVNIMQEVLTETREDVHNMDWSIDDLPHHRDLEYLSSRSSRTSPTEELEAYDLTEYELVDSGDSTHCPGWTQVTRSSSEASNQISSIRIETDSGVYTVLNTGSRHCQTPPCRYSNRISCKQAALDVQKTVLNKLSIKISSKLEDYVDCLRDSYFGTLQRCVSVLEWWSGSESGGLTGGVGGLLALTAPPRLCAPPTSWRNLLISLLHRMFPDTFEFVLSMIGTEISRSNLMGRKPIDAKKQLLLTLWMMATPDSYRIFPMGASSSCCPLSARWRRHHALLYLDDITPHTLARLISKQMLSRVVSAHERFQTGLSSVECALHARLSHTEDVKIAIRRKYAPSFACLCLESTSMCDLLKHGMPELGKEIGRGQYGVVYGVRGRWGRCSKVAAKSVIPHQERHYHDLAMEVYYTRSIPAHRNVVPLVGSVVECGAGGPAVLLLSPRRARDLHAAVRAGLSYLTRIRIAIDIVTGIRYLHSLGLVHRDVKLKNVLLDERDGAALGDLGFCAAGALLAGSLVGTPVHMAPDLLSGDYSAHVDVYAFGILFWYLCANSVKLPANFEAFQNKEQLWDKVRKGLRPERLPHFSELEWSMMESCWCGEPSRRALLGTVHNQLLELYSHAGGDLTQLS